MSPRFRSMRPLLFCLLPAWMGFATLPTTIWAAGSSPTVDARTGFEVPLAGLMPQTPDAPPPPPDDPADACAITPGPAPDFTLRDVNPSSATYGTDVPRTASAGQVTLLYIALPSCAHCQADVDDLGELVGWMGTAWDDVSVRVVALNAAPESIPELADGHDLPILQDTDEVDVEAQYGAERWYIYLLDRAGQPRVIHYSLDFDDIDQLTRLVDEVAVLIEEPAP